MSTLREFPRLEPADRSRWDRDGYLVLRQALGPDQRGRLLEAVGSLQGRGEVAGVFNAFNIIEDDDEFLELIDHPTVLGTACELLGPHLQLLMSQAMARPPTPTAPLAWHHDGPKPYHFPSVNGSVPLLNLKVGWFLTDTSGADSGNLMVLPGSHRGNLGLGTVGGQLEQSARETAELRTDLPGATSLQLAPGDAVMFHNALWHAVAPNRRQTPRVVLYYTYGPPWLRLQDRNAPSSFLTERCDPIRRQLIGALSTPDDHGGMHSGERAAPLVDLFDTRSRAEIMEQQIRTELGAVSR